MGISLSKKSKYERLSCPKNTDSDIKTWLYSPMYAKTCEPLEVPNTNILVFYSKRDFYPVVIQTQSDNAIQNTVLYLEKGLREYCLCNVKNNSKLFIIDVIDQSPAIERVDLREKSYTYISFLPGPPSYVRYKENKHRNGVSRQAKLASRIQDGPVTTDYFRTSINELSCTRYH
jgi:hypothetical protein